MLFYTIDQGRIFLIMLYAGLLVGLYVSLDGAARRLFAVGRWMALLMDVLLGVALALIVSAALLLAAEGELRLYALLGVVCGYLVYQGTLGPALRVLARWFWRPLAAGGRWFAQRNMIKKFFR